MKDPTPLPKTPFGKSVDRALRRSALRAREIARRYGTKIYVIQNGRIVGIKPDAKKR